MPIAINNLFTVCVHMWTQTWLRGFSLAQHVEVYSCPCTQYTVNSCNRLGICTIDIGIYWQQLSYFQLLYSWIMWIHFHLITTWQPLVCCHSRFHLVSMPLLLQMIWGLGQRRSANRVHWDNPFAGRVPYNSQFTEVGVWTLEDVAQYTRKGRGNM